MQNFGLKNVEQLLTICHGIPKGIQADVVYDKEELYEIYYGFQNPILFKKEMPQKDQITALRDIVGNYFVNDIVGYLLQRKDNMKNRRVSFLLKVKRETEEGTLQANWCNVNLQFTDVNQQLLEKLCDTLQTVRFAEQQHPIGTVLNHQGIAPHLNALYQEVNCIISTSEKNDAIKEALATRMQEVLGNNIHIDCHDYEPSDYLDFLVAHGIVQCLTEGTIPHINDFEAIEAQHIKDCLHHLQQILPKSIYEEIANQLRILFNLNALLTEQNQFSKEILSEMSLDKFMLVKNYYELQKQTLYQDNKTPDDYFSLALDLKQLLQLLESAQNNAVGIGALLQQLTYQKVGLQEEIQAWETQLDNHILQLKTNWSAYLSWRGKQLLDITSIGFFSQIGKLAGAVAGRVINFTIEFTTNYIDIGKQLKAAMRQITSRLDRLFPHYCAQQNTFSDTLDNLTEASLRNFIQTAAPHAGQLAGGALGLYTGSLYAEMRFVTLALSTQFATHFLTKHILDDQGTKAFASPYSALATTRNISMLNNVLITSAESFYYQQNLIPRIIGGIAGSYLTTSLLKRIFPKLRLKKNQSLSPGHVLILIYFSYQGFDYGSYNMAQLYGILCNGLDKMYLRENAAELLSQIDPNFSERILAKQIEFSESLLSCGFWSKPHDQARITWTTEKHRFFDVTCNVIKNEKKWDLHCEDPTESEVLPIAPVVKSPG